MESSWKYVILYVGADYTRQAADRIFYLWRSTRVLWCPGNVLLQGTDVWIVRLAGSYFSSERTVGRVARRFVNHTTANRKRFLFAVGL